MKRTEVLVVGAGPAGIAAATAAAKHGRKVLVLDDNAAAGGQIWRRGVSTTHAKSSKKNMAALAALHSSGAEILTGWTVFDINQSGALRAASNGNVESFEFDQLILATGARERFLPFPGWTLPGVFGVGGLQALVKGGLPIQGKRVVIAGTGPLLLAVAAHLREYGATVVSVIEQAPIRQLLPFAASLFSQPKKILQGIQYRAALPDVAYHTGCWPVAAQGNHAITEVQLTDGYKVWTEACDLLACSFHLVPNIEAASLLNCTINNNGYVQVDRLQRTSAPHVFCAGEPTGIAGLDAALVQGEIAGLAAAGELDKAEERHLQTRRVREQAFGQRLEAAFRLRPEVLRLAQEDTIVCRCEDIPFGQLKPHRSWTDAKLQTRCGMGPCQGRICGSELQALFGWQLSSVRPPLYPVPLSSFCDPPGPTVNEFEFREEKQ